MASQPRCFKLFTFYLQVVCLSHTELIANGGDIKSDGSEHHGPSPDTTPEDDINPEASTSASQKGVPKKSAGGSSVKQSRRRSSKALEETDKGQKKRKSINTSSLLSFLRRKDGKKPCRLEIDKQPVSFIPAKAN